MLHSFFTAICKVGIFMICAQAVLHFSPKASYEKYLKLLVGVMVLIQLFLPVFSLVFGGEIEETARRLESFRTELQDGIMQAEEETLLADELLEKMTLEEVRHRMESAADSGTEEQPDDMTGAELSIVVEPVQIGREQE